MLFCALFVLMLVPQASAANVPADRVLHVKPNQKLFLVNNAGEIGGFVSVQMNANRELRILVALKKVEPSATYWVWIVNCAYADGAHPCTAGPLTYRHPFGARSAPWCPWTVGAGPLTTVRTNDVGNGNSAAVRFSLDGILPGTYHNHIDVRPTPCHPSGALADDAYTAGGFSFTV